MPVRRVLIVRLGAIGDALRVLPALRRLRVDRPDLEIGWAVEDWVYPVVRANPNVDRFHVLDRRALRIGGGTAWREIRRFSGEIRSIAYDVAVDLQGRLKSGVVARMSGAPLRIGYARRDGSEGNFLFTNQRVQLPDTRENRVQRFLHMMEPLGARPELVPDDLGIVVDAAARARAEAWYAAAGRPPIAVYPGSSVHRAAYQRWQEERWSELLVRLARAGHSSAVFWGPNEEAYVDLIARGAGAGCRLAPATSLVDMMAMLGCFRLFVGSNTGAMHMSWLQGVPTVFFPGPAQPRTDAPFGGVPYRVLWAGQHFRERASRASQADCVRAVTVDEAEGAVLELLATLGAGG
jgi:ADP-heptose:LPS heptosyltransferase